MKRHIAQTKTVRKFFQTFLVIDEVTSVDTMLKIPATANRKTKKKQYDNCIRDDASVFSVSIGVSPNFAARQKYIGIPNKNPNAPSIPKSRVAGKSVSCKNTSSAKSWITEKKHWPTMRRLPMKK
mmetsp:Transcript_26834/g.61780  ORF Transcript_26834/g.61780 Transcript_26834/m.61780 type:complete len:125 (+) Transcript_26834:227-601(+)